MGEGVKRERVRGLEDLVENFLGRVMDGDDVARCDWLMRGDECEV